MRKHIETFEGWLRRVGDWPNHAEIWRLMAVTVVALLALSLLPALLLLALPLIPAVLFLGLLGAIVLMARAWFREVAFLMELGDDAFPGRNDKVIWAALLLVLPPVGMVLFRSYRVAHWPESEPKPAAPAHDLS